MRTLCYNILIIMYSLRIFMNSHLKRLPYEITCKTHTVIIYQSELCTGYVINDWD